MSPKLSLIDDIYAAALDESAWARVLARMMGETNSQGATFCILDSSDEPRFNVLVHKNFDEEMMREYTDGTMLIDPTILQIAAHPERKTFHDSAYISEAEKDRHPYYAWHEKFSDTRHRIAGMAHPARHLQSGVTLHRARRVGDFDRRSKTLVTSLYRHIERSVDIGFRLGTLGKFSAGALAVVDQNVRGVILFDKRGQITFANHAARRMAREADGFLIEDKAVRLQRNSDDRILQRLIGTVLNCKKDVLAPPGGAMAALRPSGKRPFVITVSPMTTGESAFSAMTPAGCIIITDPNKEYEAPVDRLRTLYKLTPSESRLAVRLANGEDLKAAAEALGITYPTARAQLTAIFRKTDTGRQAQLVKLLTEILPALTALTTMTF